MISKIYKSKFKNKDLWIWTGYEYEDILQNHKDILQYIDYLICGQFQEDKKDLKMQWAGSNNQRVINVQKSLKQNEIILY